MSNRSLCQCDSNIYHITERGIGRQIIFEDNSDRRSFGEKMLSVFNERKITLLAWCFMDNHVHILARGDLSDLSRAMQTINSSYARRFNARHDRVGHLFQDRFSSVPITDDAQFIAAVRYIHNNPEDLQQGCSRYYAWSSYREFFGEKSALGYTVDANYVLSILGGLEAFSKIHQEAGHDAAYANQDDFSCLKQDLISSALDGKNAYEIKSFPKQMRNEAIRALHEAGLSIRQIERVTSIGRSIIARAIACHI